MRRGADCSLSQTASAQRMTRHPISPGLHFERDFAAVTVSVQSATANGLEYVPSLVTSDREYVAVDGAQAKLESGTRLLTGKPVASPSLDRWTLGGIEDFLKQKRPPTPTEGLKAVKALLDSQMEFPEDCADEYSTLIALWVIGTYFHPIFRAYPYIELCAPRGSGKSKLQSILAALSHAGHLIVDPTEAATFRLIESARCTCLFDECENWTKQARGQFLQIINSGYTADGVVMRCDGESHSLRAFMVYSPKSFASITGVDAVTATRCIRLHLRRTHGDRGRLWFDPLADEVIAARDSLYYLTLTTFQAVQAALSAKHKTSLNNRTYQLWLPLLTMATVFGGKTVFAQMEAVADFFNSQTREPALPLLDQALLHALNGLVGPDGECEFTAEDLQQHVEIKDAWEQRFVTPQRIGIALSRLGFIYTHRSNGNFYRFDSDSIRAVAEAYDVALVKTPTETNEKWTK